jgi:LuxR family maltose regulon positive regulatory protein
VEAILMPWPLLQTKLYAPLPRPHQVARPHLTERLGDQVRRPLTLVSAPAGFGKTTLVSEWIAQTTQAVAWVSLDDDDNDPTRFLSYLIAALQRHQPGIGAGAYELLTTSQAPPPKAILTLLLNDLEALSTPLTLVLDDYHLITTPAIHEGLVFLIDHLPPFYYLVITTRIDPPLPLARWRVRNRLTEIRADDLRFRGEEAAIFLNELMGLTLSAAEIATLEARTEGWIAGLQLAALSMQGREDVSNFIQAFSGSHRHVLGYLIDEVLNRRPEGTLDFLLQTSILERLSASSCDAVTGRSDSHQVLEKIEAANLFLIPLDDTGQWYRYHHLFAEVLQSRLQQTQPDLALALHHRASEWHEQAGQLAKAINHALAAQAFERAATLVEQIALAMIFHSEFARLLIWLETLPEEEIRARPSLRLYHVWVLYISGQMSQAAAHLEAVEAMLEADEAKRTPEVQGLIAITKTRLLRDAGDLAGTITLSRQALANLPEQDTLLRARITLNLAIAHYLQGELGPASQLLTETITTGHTAQLIGPLPTIYLKAQILRAQGRLQQALQLCQEGLELVARHKWQDFPASGFLYVAMGELLREQNELSAAAEYLERGLRLGQAGGHHHILIIGHVWLAWLRQTEGNTTGSQEAIRAALQLVQQHEVSRFWPLPSAACTQARLWIAQGNLAAASRWAQTSGLNWTHTLIPYLDEAAYLTLARLRIAEGSLEVAESLLLRLHQAAAAAERSGSLIEILILQAVTYAAQKQSEKAMSVLAQALSLAEPEGYIRVFVDEGETLRLLLSDFRSWTAKRPNPEQNTTLSIYIDKLLAAFNNQLSQEDEPLLTEQYQIQNLATGTHPVGYSEASQAKSKIQNLIEPLSAREQEILQLVAEGLSNSQIAARLFITTGTVKTHINHIFGKLEVQSRTQAIARGRELGLIAN